MAQANFRTTLGVGFWLVLVGLLLVQLNFLLAEFAVIAGTNFVVDGVDVSYSAPALLWLVPGCLLGAGLITLIIGVVSGLRR